MYTRLRVVFMRAFHNVQEPYITVLTALCAIAHYMVNCRGLLMMMRWPLECARVVPYAVTGSTTVLGCMCMKDCVDAKHALDAVLVQPHKHS